MSRQRLLAKVFRQIIIGHVGVSKRCAVYASVLDQGRVVAFYE